MGIIADQGPPLNPNKPIIVVWRNRGVRREKLMPNIKAARAYAIKVMGNDDRTDVRFFDNTEEKTKRGQMALFGSQPYWKYKGQIYNIDPTGRILQDYFDY